MRLPFAPPLEPMLSNAAEALPVSCSGTTTTRASYTRSTHRGSTIERLDTFAARKIRLNRRAFASEEADPIDGRNWLLRCSQLFRTRSVFGWTLLAGALSVRGAESRPLS